MNKKGFTLVEIVVTISILSILTAITIPTYISWLPKHRLQTSVRQIYDDLNLAKMEAVRTNTVAVAIFYPFNNQNIVENGRKRYLLFSSRCISEIINN